MPVGAERITQTLAEYGAAALVRDLPASVVERAALHILDTIAAMVSGSRLTAGQKVIPYITSLGGSPHAAVIGSRTVTGAANAALANGMLGHADETDDTHTPAYVHPGCSIVAASLAAAEREQRSGRDLLRAVVLGYDVAARMSLALGSYRFVDTHHSSHAFGGLFGEAASASALYGLNADRVAHAFSYATHLASGNSSLYWDTVHVEKAFVLGGMPAQGGVQAAGLAAAGFIGSDEPLEGIPGLFAAFPKTANPRLAIEELGTRFEVMRTTLKRWSVSMPIQALLHSLEAMRAEHRFAAGDVAEIVVGMRPLAARIVDHSAMPDCNLQQQAALMLLDGKVGFASSHDHARMNDPAVVALRARIRVEPRSEPEFQTYPRQAQVSVRLVDGTCLDALTRHFPGMPESPLTAGEVSAKARDLLEPVLGAARSERLIEVLLGLATLTNVAALRPLLQGDAGQSS